MHFEYYRSVKQEFESSRLWGGVILLGFYVAFAYFYIKTKNEVVSLLAFAIIIIATLVHLFRLRKLKKSSGAWEIYVTDTEIIWRTPKEFGSGFVLLVSEISKYVESSSNLSEYRTYYLVLKNGTRVALQPNVNNFNYSSFSRALSRLGVALENEIES